MASTGTQRLQDRVAVITGAGSGIGLASARRLAAEGAVVVAVDIDEAAGKAVAEETGGTFITADVASEDDVQRLFETWSNGTGGSISRSTMRASRRRKMTPS